MKILIPLLIAAQTNMIFPATTLVHFMVQSGPVHCPVDRLDRPFGQQLGPLWGPFWSHWTVRLDLYANLTLLNCNAANCAIRRTAKGSIASGRKIPQAVPRICQRSVGFSSVWNPLNHLIHTYILAYLYVWEYETFLYTNWKV